ncbi:hypothetical protein ARGLB_028_00030 [Arthrobacter globiformis NBRC 12137]|uniref:Uncharacterized protein n=1 Tax=Arthrobacter globiformis (strain ATCC 8010 / DSM 20124 / JCM 1332 / NBRC 12137 / NCIMB 8907 / NRRL B-2979 / 168) TaxID=1077972 RepID=H0QJ77_ARTG1|nr:hypothetical protein ARGLB_028_00030 [Arthrobacter globiformis NBRC 12137]
MRRGPARSEGSWSGTNPERLAQYVRDVNNGKRPRIRSAIRRDYIETLRRRAAEDHGDDE